MGNVSFVNNSARGNSSAAYGGAIYSYGSNLTILGNVSFVNNSANGTTYGFGGAIYSSGSNLTILGNVSFVNNSANGTTYGYGGAISNYAANFTILGNVSFVNNSADGTTYGYGGAIYNSATNFTILGNVSFVNNKAISPNNGHGGAIYNNNGRYSNITNATFINNFASNNGSAIYDYYDTNSTISESNFINNSGSIGGAIYVIRSNNVSIVSSNFVNNTATYGGAIATNNTNLTLEYNRIYNNTNQGQLYLFNSTVNASYNWWGNNTNPLTYSVKINGTGTTVNLTNYFVVNITLIDVDVGNSLLIFNYTMSLNTTNGSDNALPEFNGTIDRNGGFGEFIFSANLSANLSVPFNPYINTTATARIDNFTKIFNINASKLPNVYVNATGGSDSNNGSNWTSAVKSIENALEIVQNGGTIHIAGNNYNNTNGIGKNNTNLTINKNITLLGHTVLSGEIILDALNNGRIFLINDGLNVTLINLTFANGNITGTTNNGGAIYSNGSKIIITGSKFINNTAQNGGAIYSNNGTNFIINENTSFINNTARTNNGGAIYNNRSNFSVSNSSFIGNNAARYGGAISNYDNFSVSNSSFIGNTASTNSGAISNNGNFSVSNSSFIGNTASSSGGAISSNGNFSVSNSSFIGNTASSSGGAISSNGNFSVSNSSFIGNNASNYGGAICNYGNFSVSNSSFIDNNASYGGAIYTLNNQTFINNNSFDGNNGVLGIGFNDSNINLNSYLISNNIIINNDIVLLVDGSRNNISNGSIIGNNNKRGIFVNGQNNTFSNITIANLKVSLTFNSSNHNNVFTNGTLRGSDVGVIMDGFNDTIISTTIVNNTIVGVNITGSNNTLNYNRIYQNALDMINSGNNTNANFNWWGKNNITGHYTNSGLNLNISYWYVLQLSLNSTFNTTVNATRNYTKNTQATLSYKLTLNNLTTNITNTPSLLPYFTVEVLLRNSTNTVNSITGDIRNLAFSQVLMLTNNNLQASINALADDEDIVLILDNGTNVNLTIHKVANVGNVSNNGTINFTITITNIGNDFASNVTFTDLLNNSFKLLNTTGGSYNNTTGLWTIGDIGPGVTVTLHMIVQAIKSGTINNTAGNLTAIETLVNPNINSTVTINVTPAVNLNITKVSNVTGFNTVHVGDHVNYTITVKNNGLDNGTNVCVYDILGSKLTYFNHTSSRGTYDNNTGLWNIGALNVNQTVTLEIEVIIASPGTIENIANVTANEIILNGSNTNTSTTIHVDPLNSTLTINPVTNTKVNSNVSINGTLLDEKGDPITGVIINLTVNNVSYSATTGVSGNWNIVYHVGSAGVINVVAEFVGNANYIASANATHFNALALNSTLVINPVTNTKVNSNVSINGTLLDENGVPISGVIINLTVNNVSYSATTGVSGNWNIIYHVGSAGVINVVAEFIGNANFTTSANATHFNALALNSTLIIHHIVNTKVNSNVSINGTLLDENGVPIGGVTVVVTVNGVNYSATTNAAGNWNIIHHVVSTGGINVVAEFAGNVNYIASANTSYLDGLALNSTLVINPIADTKVNSSVSINGSLLDEKDAPISGVTVVVTVNGVNYNVITDASGKWGITYLVNSKELVNVVAEFVGNSNYTAAANTTYFNGETLKSTLVINPILDTKVNSSVNINGSLFDENGVLISGVTVVVTVNGVNYNVITDANGKWGIIYLVNSNGLFNVVAEFIGNINHTAAVNSTSFNGVSLSSNLVINPVPDTKVNISVSINGTLLDDGNKAISNAHLVVTVNGVNYNATTDSYGKWNITYIVKSSGNINVVAEFTGNTKYAAAVNSTSFNGVSLSSNLVINPVPDTKVNSSVSINGTLLDDGNKAISNVWVVVTVDGVNYNVTTGVSGKWNITYIVKSSGSINVVAEFTGNTNYAAAVNSTNFNGVSLNSTLVINPITSAKMNSSVGINGTLLDESNKAISNVWVVVTVNGVNYNATTGVSGKWNINYAVNSTGLINVVAVFDGNDKYVSATNSTTFIVHNNVNISIIKIASINGINNSAKAHIGDTVIYTINVVNNGATDATDATDATGVLVTEIIDNTKLKFNKASVTQGSYNNTNGLWSIGKLTAGKTATLTINVTIIAIGNISNSANVSVSENNINSNNKTTVNISVNDVNISMIMVSNVTEENNPHYGDVVTYKIIITNNGITDGHGVNITDILGGKLKFINYSTTDGSIYDKNTGLWFIGTLKAGNNVTLTITAKINDIGEIENIAKINTNESNINNKTNDGIKFTVNDVNLTIVKTSNITGNPLVEDYITYTIKITNHGLTTASNFNVLEKLNSKLQFISYSSNMGTYDHISGSWNISTLSSGKTATLTINAKIIDVGTIENTATINTNNNNNNNIGNNNSSTNIISEAIPSQINTLNVIATVDNSFKLESTLKDNKGRPIADKEVKFYVNGKLIGTAKTDVKGVAYFRYTPTKTGTLTYTSSFTDPTGIYTDSTSSKSIITVTKDEITLTTILPTGYLGDKKTINIKATNSEGKSLPNKRFTVYINGKKIGNYKTNSKGEFTIKTTLKYSNKLQIKFAGDSKYNKLSKTYTYTAKSKKGKTITTIYYAKTIYDKATTLKAKLTNLKGKALADKYIKFYVAGKYVGKAKTNKKGIAILKYTPKKKK
ncbi:DUF11 domain-containing protein [Methanobrevibacter filiformis]|uniref:Putative outer membrane protein pmp19 n=1 Tax=Methanobrevibacter filiformis TaxID=55758 RepID=A0A162FH71_9EURY|nr:DUF11 domain-containing protein [Methanobrevibacter filiformis]KZX09890.1 putative outer membrane protein pmp19 precursor [Methanobrevibacter filiformis]